MSQRMILSSLIRFDAPVTDLKAGVVSGCWDTEPVVTLTRRHVVAVLERFIHGEINAAAVEEWANLIECREEIVFEPGYEENITGVIFDLANPEVQGRLAMIAPDALSRLR